MFVSDKAIDFRVSNHSLFFVTLLVEKLIIRLLKYIIRINFVSRVLITKVKIENIPREGLIIQKENLHSLERAEHMMVRWMCGVSMPR